MEKIMKAEIYIGEIMVMKEKGCTMYREIVI